MQGAEGTHSLEPQKAYFTGEFVVVTKNGGRALLCMLATGHEAVRRKFKFKRFFKNSIPGY